MKKTIGFIAVLAVGFVALMRSQTPIGVYSTGIPGAVAISATNLPFTLVQTNFVSGQLYTNTYSAIIEVSAGAVLTPASVSGTVAMWLASSGYQTNAYSEGTIVGTIVAPMTNNLSLKVPAGNAYTFTNMSSGAGNSASILGGQILVY